MRNVSKWFNQRPITQQISDVPTSNHITAWYVTRKRWFIFRKKVIHISYLVYRRTYRRKIYQHQTGKCYQAFSKYLASLELWTMFALQIHKLALASTSVQNYDFMSMLNFSLIDLTQCFNKQSSNWLPPKCMSTQEDLASNNPSFEEKIAVQSEQVPKSTIMTWSFSTLWKYWWNHNIYSSIYLVNIKTKMTIRKQKIYLKNQANLYILIKSVSNRSGRWFVDYSQNYISSAIEPASLFVWRWAWLKCDRTVTTAFLTFVPKKSSAVSRNWKYKRQQLINW